MHPLFTNCTVRSVNHGLHRQRTDQIPTLYRRDTDAGFSNKIGVNPRFAGQRPFGPSARCGNLSKTPLRMVLAPPPRT